MSRLTSPVLLSSYPRLMCIAFCFIACSAASPHCAWHFGQLWGCSLLRCGSVRFVSVHFKLPAQAVGFSFGSSFVSSRFGALCFPRLALMFPFFIYFFFLCVCVLFRCVPVYSWVAAVLCYCFCLCFARVAKGSQEKEKKCQKIWIEFCVEWKIGGKYFAKLNYARALRMRNTKWNVLKIGATTTITTKQKTNKNGARKTKMKNAQGRPKNRT